MHSFIHAKNWLRSHRAQTAWTAVALGAFAAMYWHVGGIFFERWFSSPAYYHCIAVPFIAGWLVWRRWDRLAQVEIRPATIGLVILLFGLLLYWVSARTGVRMVAGATIPLVIAGMIASIYGMSALRMLVVPIGVLAFAIPLPEHAIGIAAMPMQEVSAAITGHVAPLIGLEVIRQGINLNLGGFTFVVAQECSGMHSLVALLLTGFILVELSGLAPNQKVAAIVLILPIVLFANVIRLVVVLLLGQYFGPDFATGLVVHGFSDIIVYVAAVLSLVLLIGWMYDLSASPASEPPEATAITVQELERMSANDAEPVRSLRTPAETRRSDR